MKRIVAFMLAGAAGLAVPSLAQDAAVTELYGNGVHAYYAGQYREAHNSLTSAISSGTQDPRCYYYRGLSFLRLGRPNEAKNDFTAGAALEYGDAAGLYHVDRALERCQGAGRLTVERYRAAARTSGAARQPSER